MTWTLFRCEHGHEANAVKPLAVCPYPRCDGKPVAVRGPLAPKKEKAK